MNILLLGAGEMANDYAKVLLSLNLDFQALCRSQANAQEFSIRHNVRCSYGGLSSKFLSENSFTHIIIAVDVNSLTDLTKLSINCGIKNILVEKPLALYYRQIKELSSLAVKKHSEIFVGYNRRFYNSVYHLQSLAKKDGGISSLEFDFTEWSDSISSLNHKKIVKERWALANSSHIMDLAFFLAGRPKKIFCFSSGSLDWHNSASKFSGAGVSINDIPFSYRADWDAPGRWGVNVYSKNLKFSLSPLEDLFVTKRNSTKAEKIRISENSSDSLKHGLLDQIKAFLGFTPKIDLCTLEEHKKNFKFYLKIAGYLE
jgi:hypothetical protein